MSHGNPMTAQAGGYRVFSTNSATSNRSLKSTPSGNSAVLQQQFSNDRDDYNDRGNLSKSHTVTYVRSAEMPVSYTPVRIDSERYHPVLQDHSPFGPEEDAKMLHNAMKGKNDEKTIIAVLTRRSNRQRQMIAERYHTMYKKDLTKELKSELSGTLEDVLLGLMDTPSAFDAKTLHKAIQGLGTDEKVLIEIIGSRTPAELHHVQREYQELFKTTLQKDVAGDTSGFFKTLLLAKLGYVHQQANAGANGEFVPKQAYHEAQALWEMGPKKWQKNDHFFLPLFAERSEEHMRELFHFYKQIGHIDIEKDIEKELSGDAKDLLLALVRVSKNRPAYFAERLHTAMEGRGVDAKAVIRVIVSRAEKDLLSIMREFGRMYGQPLESAIQNEFSGDAKRVLLAILSQAPQ